MINYFLILTDYRVRGRAGWPRHSGDLLATLLPYKGHIPIATAVSSVPTPAKKRPMAYTTIFTILTIVGLISPFDSFFFMSFNFCAKVHIICWTVFEWDPRFNKF